MIITPHILAGSALATALTDNLPMAFLIGFFAHFILDAIPHVDPGTFHNIKIPGIDVNIELGKFSEDKNKPWPLWIYIYAVLEFIFAWILIIILFRGKPNFDIIIAGGIGGIAVDILDNSPFHFLRRWPILKQLHFLHHKVHYDLPPGKWYWGLPTQIIVIGVSLWYLLKF